MTVLEAVELYRFFHAGDEETQALRGVSLRVPAGEIIALVGPSGSGKSTLLACCAGLDEPDGGRVLIAGSRLTRRPERVRAELRARHIGVLMQSSNLIRHLSVEENIRLPMALAGRRNEKLVTELLEAMDLAGRRRAAPEQLSGGEAARAGLAVALAAEPKLLLADEPTGEVDAATETQILELFERFRANGGAALIATHSETLAARASRVVRLGYGRIANG